MAAKKKAKKKQTKSERATSSKMTPKKKTGKKKPAIKGPIPKKQTKSKQATSSKMAPMKKTGKKKSAIKRQAPKKQTKSKQSISRKMTSMKKTGKKKPAIKGQTPKKQSANKAAHKKVPANTVRKKSKSTRRKPIRRISQSEETTAFLPKGPVEPAGGQSGDLQGLSSVEGADSESVVELLEEGNSFEAAVVAGVENAENSDPMEVRTHEVPEDDVPDEYLDRE
jgi:hypothetical protein